MSRAFVKLCVLMAFSIALLPVEAHAVTQQIGSGTGANWKVSEAVLDSLGHPVLDSSGHPVTTDLGAPQYVCLNAQTTPNNCPTGATSYGYSLPAWAADLSSHVPNANWIWASKKLDGTPITGTTTGAANAQYSFTLTFYLCGLHPQDGTIWVAADDNVDVYVNGANVPVLSWGGASSLGSVTIPGASLNVSPTANTIELRVKNGADPADCGTDQYQCNPAGVLFGGDFSDELNANPTCGNPHGNVGDLRTIGSCPAPQIGSEYSACICVAGNAGWFNEPGTCMSPPVQCKGSNGGFYNPNDSESLGSCPSGQTGKIDHLCGANGSWGPTSDTCTTIPPPSRMCPDAGGNLTVPINTSRPAACPAPTTSGTATQICSPDGTWQISDVSHCSLPPVGGDGICGSSSKGQTAACSVGQMCGSCSGPKPGKPVQCILGIDCPVPIQTSDWYCDCSKYQGAALGKSCNTNYACASGYCDAGANTRQTNLCMPRGNTGQKDDPCTADNQCSNSVPLKCVGLKQNVNGSWEPGHCE